MLCASVRRLRFGGCGRIRTMRKSASCSIGVLGTFDTDLFDDALAPRVLRRELKARLPGAKIITFAPYGALRPTPRDGGEAAEPLGRWSPDPAAALTAGPGCAPLSRPDPVPGPAPPPPRPPGDPAAPAHLCLAQMQTD